MTHPTHQLDGEYKKFEESYQRNILTNDHIHVRTEYFDPVWGCQRSNCSWCLRTRNDPEAIALEQQLRQKTLDYLKRLRKLAQMSFMNTMLMTTTMNPDNYQNDDDDEYDDSRVV